MMDKKTLAQVGLFTIAVVGYVLGTGIIGVIMGIDSDGDDHLFPICSLDNWRNCIWGNDGHDVEMNTRRMKWENT